MTEQIETMDQPVNVNGARAAAPYPEARSNMAISPQMGVGGVVVGSAGMFPFLVNKMSPYYDR